VLSPTEAKGSTFISFTSDGFQLRRLYQFLTSAFCLKTIFKKELIKAIEIAINAET